MQTRRQTVIEVLTGTVTGFIGSFLITLVVFHAIKDIGTAALVNTAACTVWSLVRGYCVRRWFNGLQPRSSGPAPDCWSLDSLTVPGRPPSIVGNIIEGQIIRGSWPRQVGRYARPVDAEVEVPLTDDEWAQLYWSEMPGPYAFSPQAQSFSARR